MGELATSTQPDLRSVHLALGSGRFDEAEARAADLAREYPACAEAWLLLATLACQLGRWREAQAAAERAIELEQGSAQAHYIHARALKATGDLAQAERAYRRALDLEPDYPEALVSLAIVLRARGERDEALSLLERASQLQPAMTEALLHLGVALLERGALQRAAQALEQAVSGAPRCVEAWLALGDAGAGQSEWEAALRAFDAVVALDQRHATGHHRRGLALARLGRHAHAVEAFRTALRLDPSARGAQLALAAALTDSGAPEEALAVLEQILRADAGEPAAHGNRGLALRALHRHQEAAEAFRRACELAPQDAHAWSNLGLAEQWLDNLEVAEACFQRALGLAREAIEPLLNLAGLRDEQGRFEDGAALLRDALARQCDRAQLLSNLGVRLVALRRPDEALQCFERALTLDPSLHSARLSAGVAHLLRGDYAAGWAGYETRWRAVPALNTTRPIHAAEWTGEPLSGEPVLAYAEQGLGDTLQFVRYVPLLAARGARVVLLVQAPLKALLVRVEGVASVHAFGESLPPVKYQVALLSLPRLFGTTLDCVPASIPYLRVDERHRAAWARRLAAPPGLRVGLVWAGDPRPSDRHATVVDRRRSIRLAEFSPLWSVPGVQWYSLQKGRAASQSRDPSLGVRLIDHTDRLHDFADTAALVLNLDLVISVDTSVAHLAGALGKPVWLLSRFDGCWRWLLARDDSPWYPTLRIFRQAVPFQWGEEIERVAAALTQLTAAQSAAAVCKTNR